MTPQEINIEYLKGNIAHCVSMIALCRAQGSFQAEASYEEQLALYNRELEDLSYSNLIARLEAQHALGEIQ